MCRTKIKMKDDEMERVVETTNRWSAGIFKGEPKTGLVFFFFAQLLTLTNKRNKNISA